MTEFLGKAWELLLLFLRQFAGGPGPAENNLVRFGLPIVLWALLMYIAWSRQRAQVIPREKLLMWGFGLGLGRELFMFGTTVIRILNPGETGIEQGLHQPVEHALAMAAVVVVAGAYLRFILDDEKVSRRYLQVGLGTTAAFLVIVSFFWLRHQTAEPEIMFHQTWEAWLFHLPLSILIIIAIVILGRKNGWLRNVIVTALFFFFISEMIILVNYATDRAFSQIICPIGNSLHILAIPLLGYVYFKEQSIEKERAEASLSAYRGHLEELVEERTTALKNVNRQLNKEIGERKQAEVEIARRNDRLAAQNAVAATLSESLDLDVILNSALDTVLAVLAMGVGFVYLLNPENGLLKLKICKGKFLREAMLESLNEECLCRQSSLKAVENGGVIIHYIEGPDDHLLSSCFSDSELLTLVSIPLISKGRVVGVMTLGASQKKKIQQEDQELLTAIGQQIGMAVENATLYQDAEHWAEDLVRLNQAGAGLTSFLESEQILKEIVRQAAWLLNCQVSLVCSWSKRKHTVEVLASYGITAEEKMRLSNPSLLTPLLFDLSSQQHVLTIYDFPVNGRPQTYSKSNSRQGNLIGLQLRNPQKPEKFLLLLDRQSDRVWRAKELELIGNFANRAEVALTNANLHRQMEWTAALEERQRIAADMHDGLAQTISLLGLKVDRANELLEKGANDATKVELDQMREVVGRASSEARRSIASLRNLVQQPCSLQELLTKLISQFRLEYGANVSFDEQFSEPLILPPEQREQVLPVVQEALLNAHRHAQSEQIHLSLKHQGEAIKLTITDNGQGFSEEISKKRQTGHFGLSIMQARATRLGGKLEVQSTPGQGTRVTFIWPAKAGQHQALTQVSETSKQQASPLSSLEVGS